MMNCILEAVLRKMIVSAVIALLSTYYELTVSFRTTVVVVDSLCLSSELFFWNFLPHWLVLF